MYAPSRSACEAKRDEFALRFKKTDPKACATLARDRERMVSFFAYPKQHWVYLRATDEIDKRLVLVTITPARVTAGQRALHSGQ
jgi:transposase-like protein